mgnify:CR=1 FL=1
MVQLSEDWRVSADEVQFTLQKRAVKNLPDGEVEDVWVNKYYYPTLQMALLAYMTKRLRQKVRNYQPEELRDVVDHVDKVYEKLAKLSGEWKIATNDSTPAEENEAEADDLDFLN